MIQIIFDEEKDRREGYIDCCHIIIDDHGIKQQKVIRTETLYELLEKTKEHKKKELFLGRVPRGYLATKQRIEDFPKIQSKTAIFLEEDVRRIIYENSVYEIPIPNLMMIHFKKGETVRSLIGQLFYIMREETKQKIFIIGCGGTGSNYIKELARYLATNRNYMINADVILIDGDTVEEKNLERQSFTPEDLLMNKAEAMALAVSDMYNLTFSYVPEYIASKEHMLRIMRNTYERESYEEEETFVPIIIGCVDNHNCRKILHEIFEEYTDIIYIDAANEFSTGEVVVGIKNNQAVIAPDRAFYFPEVLEDSKSVLEMSCTELNNVKPQHLVTNLFAANICLIQTIKILSGDWTCGGIYSFDAFGCSCTRTDPNLIKQQQKGKLK